MSAPATIPVPCEQRYALIAYRSYQRALQTWAGAGQPDQDDDTRAQDLREALNARELAARFARRALAQRA